MPQPRRCARARPHAARRRRQSGNASVFGGGRGGGPRGVGQRRWRRHAGADRGSAWRERYQQDFAAFRASARRCQARALGCRTSVRWSAPSARRVYKLVDGKPQQTMVRIGASDGTDTEVSGDIKEGDLIVTGERAAQ